MAYTPSLFRVSKYGKYLSYYMEFMKRGDFGSISAAMKYVLLKKLPSKPRIVTTRMGTFKLRQGTTDFQFTNFSYETEIKKYLLRKGKDIGLFIDIGACIGEYAIWLGKQGIPCVAIEPVNHHAVIENMALNHIAPGQINVLKCAVGSENKKVSFNVLEGVTSSSHMSEADGGGDIDCKRLDDIIDLSRVDTSKPIVIKLDVEGMEIEALKGAERLIKQAPKLEIVYEYCSCGDMNIRAVLDQYAKFTYRDLDGVNTLAVKVNS